MSKIINCPDENLFLYLNITGELFYIAMHRMEVQGIEPQLRSTVAHQLILAITSPEVVNELAKGQLRLCDQSHAVMRNLLKDLVDGTLMKISDFSMEKLFELTLIATKYQYTVCSHPKDILLIALNHLDTMRRKYQLEKRALMLTEDLHHLLVQSFCNKSRSEMELYQREILRYVDDIKLKMTNLVNLGLQNENGDFIKQEADKLAYPEDDENEKSEAAGIKEISFDRNFDRRRMHSLELNGDRVITLGRSIYDQKLQDDLKILEEAECVSTDNLATKLQFCDDSLKAVQGLDFCSALLGATSKQLSSDFLKSGSGNYSQKVQDSNSRFKGHDLTQTIRIDGTANRVDSNLALVEIGRKLEATGIFGVDGPEKASSGKKTKVSELMEMFAD